MTPEPVSLVFLFSHSRSGWVAVKQLIHILESWEEGERSHKNGFRGVIHGMIAQQLTEALASAGEGAAAARSLSALLDRVEKAFLAEAERGEKTPALVKNLLIALGSFRSEALAATSQQRAAEAALSEEDESDSDERGDSELDDDGSALELSADDEFDDEIDGSDLEVDESVLDLPFLRVETSGVSPDDSGLALDAVELADALRSTGRAGKRQDFDELVLTAVSGRSRPGRTGDDDEEILGLVGLDEEFENPAPGMSGLLGMHELEIDLLAEASRFNSEQDVLDLGPDDSGISLI